MSARTVGFAGTRRRIGLASAAALVVTNMIGTGVFTISGFALADLGRPEPVLVAWLVGGVLAMSGTLSYGALARRLPQSGGEYTFLTLTVHPLAGFLAGGFLFWRASPRPWRRRSHCRHTLRSSSVRPRAPSGSAPWR